MMMESEFRQSFAQQPVATSPNESEERNEYLQKATEHLQIYEVDLGDGKPSALHRGGQEPSKDTPPNPRNSPASVTAAESLRKEGLPNPVTSGDNHQQRSGSQSHSYSKSPAARETSEDDEARRRHHNNYHTKSHRHKSHKHDRTKRGEGSRSRSRSPELYRHHRHHHKSSRHSPNRGRSRSRDRRKHRKREMSRSTGKSRSRSRSRSGRKDHHHQHRRHHHGANDNKRHRHHRDSSSPRREHHHSRHHNHRYRSRTPSPPSPVPRYAREQHLLPHHHQQQQQLQHGVDQLVHLDQEKGGQEPKQQQNSGEIPSPCALPHHVDGAVEDLHRTESGRGLVVKLKIRPPYPAGLQRSEDEEGSNAEASGQQKQHGNEEPVVLAGQAIPPGLLAARLSFADDIDIDLLQAAGHLMSNKSASVPPGTSPMVLSPRKVIHEQTLVTIAASPPGVSPRALPSIHVEAQQPEPPVSPMAGPTILMPFVFGSARAQGMRPYMEDRHTIVENYMPQSSTGHEVEDDIPRCFAGVYDGHNGSLAADHAADRLHSILAAEACLRTCTGDGPPATLIREEERMTAALVHSFEATDKEILTRCRLEGVRGGATGVVIVRIGEILYAAHCGDSRAVMCRSGEPLRLTEDHKPNLPRERKRVEALGGRVDFARCWRVIVDPGNGRPASGLAVSRAFGDPDFKEPLHLVTASPDVISERLLPGDSFVILASDGLWDVLSDKEACDLVSDHLQRAVQTTANPPPLEMLANTAAEVLVEASLKAGTMDNVTALVALLQWT